MSEEKEVYDAKKEKTPEEELDRRIQALKAETWDTYVAIQVLQRKMSALTEETNNLKKKRESMRVPVETHGKKVKKE